MVVRPYLSEGICSLLFSKKGLFGLSVSVQSSGISVLTLFFAVFGALLDVVFRFVELFHLLSGENFTEFVDILQTEFLRFCLPCQTRLCTFHTIRAVFAHTVFCPYRAHFLVVSFVYGQEFFLLFRRKEQFCTHLRSFCFEESCLYVAVVWTLGCHGNGKQE